VKATGLCRHYITSTNEMPGKRPRKRKQDELLVPAIGDINSVIDIG
jgi:hypothetical protein